MGGKLDGDPGGEGGVHVRAGVRGTKRVSVRVADDERVNVGVEV